MEALRKTEQQGREAAQRGFEMARDTWEDAERRLRRKMRIFPGKARRNAALRPPALAGDAESDARAGMEVDEKKRTA